MKFCFEKYWVSLLLCIVPLAHTCADTNDYTLHMIGNAHIDLAYRWRWNETVDRVGPVTFEGVLRMLDKEPGLTYAQSQLALYEETRNTTRCCLPE